MSTHPDDSTTETTGTEAGAEGEAPALQFPTLATFVEQQVSVVYNRALTQQGTHWCPQWWVHPEAVFVLTALWQAWEHMHVHDGPTASAKWLTYYFYPLMRELTGPEGPFHGCTPQRGHNLSLEHPDGLPLTAPPPEVLDPRG